MSNQAKKNKYATKKIITIEGKAYRRRYHFGSKMDAAKYAQTQRDQGKSARILKHVGAYTVYTRG